MPNKNPVHEMHDTVEEAFLISSGDNRIFRVGLSIIVPVYNEAQAIPLFLNQVLPLLDGFEKKIQTYFSSKCLVAEDANCEIIFIDDGSSDDTSKVITKACAEHSNIKLICFSRNFGKEAALTAGIDHAQGAAVVPIDVDLQDPPDLISKMIDKWAEGYDVVSARRVDRSSDSNTKKITSAMFYRLFNKISDTSIPNNVGDYRLMTFRVIKVLRTLKEKNRFMKGLFAWAGFKQTAIDYVRPKRSAGTTSFNYWKLWNFALDGIISFSSAPLRVWSYIGALVSLTSLLATLLMISMNVWLMSHFQTSTILISLLLTVGGFNLIAMGVIGEYLGRVFSETRDRPIYVLDSMTNFSKVLEEDDGHNKLAEHGTDMATATTAQYLELQSQ